MAWSTPKTDWVSADVIGNSDLNRIEANIAEVANVTGTSGQLGQNVTATLDVGEAADIVNVGAAATTVSVGKAGETINLLGDVTDLIIQNDFDATNDITAGNDLAYGGNFIPKSPATGSSIAIAISSSSVVPLGIWNYQGIQGGGIGSALYVEIFVSGAWRFKDVSSSGVVISDGVNVRFTNSSLSQPTTVYLLKF